MSGLILESGKESRMELEELSTKVKSDIVKLIDVLEVEVQRLRKFEDATDRLRNYNGELRQALIKEQARNSAVIKIPDGGEGGQLFNCKCGEEVSPTLTSYDAVVSNTVVMDLVFKKMDVKTIKKCRLIDKKWNEKASYILSRQNGGYGLAVRLEKEMLNGTIAALRRRKILGLHSIVASAPLNWFSKALLNKSFTQMPGVQSVMQSWGYRLKSIEITGSYFRFQHAHKILVDWCPNLEQLALPTYLVVRNVEYSAGEEELLEGFQQLVFTKPLKLTGLFMGRQLCISVVKASPNLKTLSFNCDSDKYSFQYFKELLNCPEVTTNLENVKLDTGCGKVERSYETIKLFNSIQFSSKLKKLAIEAGGNHGNKELSETLEKFGGSLEKLVLIVANPLDRELAFPRMANLTELRYFTDATEPINSIKFLIGMPNLKTLYVGQRTPMYLGQEYFIDTLFSDCEQLRRNPHKKLKEFYLFGYVRSPSLNFQMLNIIFPNLTRLVVGLPMLRLCHLFSWQEMRKYYEDMFISGLSEMPNLKELYLDFRCLLRDDEELYDYMAVIFDQLNKLSNLTHLTVRDNSNSTTSLKGDKLVEIPNLRILTLIGFKLDLLAAKELTILLYKHEIQLDIEDIYFEEDFRAHFEEQLTFKRRDRYH